MSTNLPLFSRAQSYGDRVAIVDRDGPHTYQDLLAASARVAEVLLDGRSDLKEARIAFVVPPDFSYVAIQWGIWRAGGIAVPLATSHPPTEWEYVLRDAEAEVVVSDAVEEAIDRAARAVGSVRAVKAADCLSRLSPTGDCPRSISKCMPPTPRRWRYTLRVVSASKVKRLMCC